VTAFVKRLANSYNDEAVEGFKPIGTTSRDWYDVARQHAKTHRRERALGAGRTSHAAQQCEEPIDLSA
jgi:hypothetical protein